MAEPTKFIAIIGNTVDGHRFVGPYDDAEIAANAHEGDGDWWVTALDAPTVPPNCTGRIEDGLLAHDGETCPIHESSDEDDARAERLTEAGAAVTNALANLYRACDYDGAAVGEAMHEIDKAARIRAHDEMVERRSNDG